MKTIAILITLLLIININIYQGNSTEVLASNESGYLSILGSREEKMS